MTVIGFGLCVVFIYVPYMAKLNKGIIIERNAEKVTISYVCPVCHSDKVFGDGFTDLLISEFDKSAYRTQPFKRIPVLACRDCGVVRLDLKRISNQPLTALESLEMRLQ